MWLQSLDCGCGQNMAGLSAVDPASIAAAFIGSAMQKPGSAAGAAGGAPGVMVSTQVSPQISPTFVQQDNPSNSPVYASASQSAPFVPPNIANPLPGTPATGLIPGFDAGGPSGVPVGAGYLYPNTLQQSSGGLSGTQWALIAGGIVLAAIAFKKRGAIAGHVRRVYSRIRGH